MRSGTRPGLAALRMGRAITGVSAIAILLALSACLTSTSPSREETPVSEESCPKDVADQIAIVASSAPRILPMEIGFQDAAVKIPGVLARRVIIGFNPKEALQGLKVVSSTLSVDPLGGTFIGWAHFVDPREGGSADDGRSNSIDVTPGRLRIAPFLSGKKIHAQSVSFDVALVPGGVPVDEMSVTLQPLWDTNGKPRSAEKLRVTLTPVRHMTIFDSVEGRAQLTVHVSSKAPGQVWECSAEAHFILADHDVIRPPLWDIGRPDAGGGRRKLWLAFYDPQAGPFRVIFENPSAASDFTAWLKETGAPAIGQFKLGMFRRDETSGQQTVNSVDRSIMQSYQPITAEDMAAIRVAPLGEP